MTATEPPYDVVVVGYGFAGAATACAAADGGARVLLVEKTARGGGISICSAGGVRIAKDADEAFRYLVETNAGTAPEESLRALASGMATVAERIKKYAVEAGATVSVDWIAGNYPFPGHDTFGFASVTDVPGLDFHAEWPHVRGLRAGARLYKVMTECVKRRGIEVRFGTRAKRLVRSPAGAVSGVVVETNDVETAVSARGGVVLACGGFEGDDKMKSQYWQEKPVLPGAFRGNTGDGIRMAQDVGADLWHMWHFHGTYGFRHTDPNYPFGIRLFRLPDWLPGAEDDDREAIPFFSAARERRMPWILVDRTGRRFANEYHPYMQDTGHRWMEPFDPVTQTYPRIPSWMIVDETARKTFALGFPTYNDPDVSYEWSADNSREIANGILMQAGTVAEMAAKMEADPAILAATIERWNAMCRVGKDAEFGRLPDTMMPIEKPPYTFGNVWPLVANTQGGPVHDVGQRVLDVFGAPIPGLFSAGEIGSVFGHLYLSGGNLAECFVGGDIAGRAAAVRASAAKG